MVGTKKPAYHKKSYNQQIYDHFKIEISLVHANEDLLVHVNVLPGIILNDHKYLSQNIYDPIWIYLEEFFLDPKKVKRLEYMIIMVDQTLPNINKPDQNHQTCWTSSTFYILKSYTNTRSCLFETTYFIMYTSLKNIF